MCPMACRTQKIIPCERHLHIPLDYHDMLCVILAARPVTSSCSVVLQSLHTCPKIHRELWIWMTKAIVCSWSYDKLYCQSPADCWQVTWSVLQYDRPLKILEHFSSVAVAQWLDHLMCHCKVVSSSPVHLNSFTSSKMYRFTFSKNLVLKRNNYRSFKWRHIIRNCKSFGWHHMIRNWRFLGWH
jgi:hypothetical protein